ncbi:MAG: methyl-accepting chemotaxis protein [Candidatus Adiutrix sp.]|jgi:methyl-accepting chemotaxis protein|nr:methyl-accepting chemotaxis protein [Candidatus Adiutrix sp.]
MKFKTKILLTCLIAGIVPAAVIAAAVYFVTSPVYVQMTNLSLSAFKKGSEHIIATRISDLGKLGSTLAENAEVQAAVAEKNKAAFDSQIKLYLDDGELDYLAVFDTSGQPVFISQSKNLETPLNPGTLLAKTAQDKAVPAATSDGKIDIKYVTSLRDSRGVPLGQLVAGVFPFTESFLDELKSMFGVEFTIFRDDTRSMTTIVSNGQRAIGTKMTNPVVIERVLRQGQEFHDKNVILGGNYDTVYWPVRDSSDAVIGMYFLGMPSTIVEQTQKKFYLTVGALMLGTIILVVLGGTLTAHSINTVLCAVMDRMNDSFKQVRMAVKDINHSSDALAKGASIQATSLEETSAALEEMTAMINQNAENSSKTNSENQVVDHHITEGSKLVDDMVVAMNEISESAGKIGAIIKTIESIAFQTNLLALNASVEAARAGEAGQGFAVVADEVRNLAQRSTQAAGDTNSLINSTVTRVGNGVRITGLLSESFTTIRQGSSVVSQLIDEIAGASKEQFIGIEQVGKAVNEINKVAGANSESSEATSSASRELANAAGDLHDVMVEMTILVNGCPDLDIDPDLLKD